MFPVLRLVILRPVEGPRPLVLLVLLLRPLLLRPLLIRTPLFTLQILRLLTIKRV